MVRPRVELKEPTIIRDDLPVLTTDHIDLVSDAAVHVAEKKGAICWHALDKEDRRLSAYKPIFVTDNSHSYRHELEGIYESITFTTKRRPLIKQITSHCDNESGINKLEMPIRTPGDTMQPEADIIMATKKKKYIEDNGIDMTFKHVKGHTDRAKKTADISRIEQVNIDCDTGAAVCVNEGIPAQQFTPLNGSKCMVKVHDQWITSNLEKAIQYHVSSRKLEAYISDRLKIPAEVVKTIDRKAIGAARSTHRWARLARTTKMMAGWLPVGHNWRHHGALTDRCPGCGVPDETFEHLFQCSNPTMVEVRRTQLGMISQIATEQRIPSELYTLALHILRCLQTPTFTQPSLPPFLNTLWAAQEVIGLERFALGWLSTKWHESAVLLGSKDPESVVVKLITLIWDGWCEPLWEARNNILKRQPNPTELTEHRTIKERLCWFRRHKNRVLPVRFRFL